MLTFLIPTMLISIITQARGNNTHANSQSHSALYHRLGRDIRHNPHNPFNDRGEVMPEKIENIIYAYHEIGTAMNNLGAIDNLPAALEKLEAALTAVDVNDYKPQAQGFITDMAYNHRKAVDLMGAFEHSPALMLVRLKEHHASYLADVNEADDIINHVSRLTPYALRPGLEVCGGTV